jgi:hypothetical protein
LGNAGNDVEGAWQIALVARAALNAILIQLGARPLGSWQAALPNSLSASNEKLDEFCGYFKQRMR